MSKKKVAAGFSDKKLKLIDDINMFASVDYVYFDIDNPRCSEDTVTLLNIIEKEAQKRLAKKGHDTSLTSEDLYATQLFGHNVLVGRYREKLHGQAAHLWDVLVHSMLIRKAREQGNTDAALYNALKLGAAMMEASIMPQTMAGNKKAQRYRQAHVFTVKCAYSIHTERPDIPRGAIASKLHKFFKKHLQAFGYKDEKDAPPSPTIRGWLTDLEEQELLNVKLAKEQGLGTVEPRIKWTNDDSRVTKNQKFITERIEAIFSETFENK